MKPTVAVFLLLIVSTLALATSPIVIPPQRPGIPMSYDAGYNTRPIVIPPRSPMPKTEPIIIGPRPHQRAHDWSFKLKREDLVKENTLEATCYQRYIWCVFHDWGCISGLPQPTRCEGGGWGGGGGDPF